jgi:hypothetical protein
VPTLRMDNNVQVGASSVGVVHVHTTDEKCWCEWRVGVGEWASGFLVWCATVWCVNASSCVLLAAGSRATRRFVRPLPSQGRLAANPREWFSAPPQAHAPKAPNESNQSIDSILSPCPARPTTAVHDACCCTLSAFWTRWAHVGSRWPPPNSPPNFPCSSAWSLHGWWPATLCTSSRKIQQPPYGLAL